MSRLPRDLVIFGQGVLNELVAVHGGQSPYALST